MTTSKTSHVRYSPPRHRSHSTHRFVYRCLIWIRLGGLANRYPIRHRKSCSIKIIAVQVVRKYFPRIEDCFRACSLLFLAKAYNYHRKAAAKANHGDSSVQVSCKQVEDARWDWRFPVLKLLTGAITLTSQALYECYTP